MAYNFEKLEELLKEKGVGQDDITDIIAPLRKMAEKRRYGLVWEEPGDSSYEKDQAEQALEKAFAFLKEVPERRIEKAPEKPMNLLIEGDNYHSLKALQYTHKGLVDVIYIDPPYNTQNRDFIYNDRFVDAEDSWRHSTWLSFMNKRLRLSRELMSENGVVFISIDDNEQAQLKLLCDQVFGERNKLGIISVVNNLKGRSDDAFFATSNEFMLVYAKDYTKATISGLMPGEEYEKEFKYSDEISKYKKVGLKKTGKNSFRTDRPNMFYAIYYDTKSGVLSLENESENSVEILPYINGKEGRWRWGKDTFLAKKDTELVVSMNRKGEYVIDVKMRNLVDGKPRTVRPKTTWIDPKYDSGSGTRMINDFDLGGTPFTNPKPLEFMKDVLRVSTNRNFVVLDFFAGSGTTAHAVMALNEEDGGNRHFILCTNNENNICEEVTYERLKRVINGYTTPKNKEVAGIPNNLAYYKVDLLTDTGDSDANRLQAILNAVDLIAIKEQAYEKEVGEKLTVLRNADKVVYVVTDFFSLMDEDMDAIVADLLAETEGEKVLYTNYAEYANEQVRYRGEDMPEELLGVLR